MSRDAVRSATRVGDPARAADRARSGATSPRLVSERRRRTDRRVRGRAARRALRSAIGFWPSSAPVGARRYGALVRVEVEPACCPSGQVTARALSGTAEILDRHLSDGPRAVTPCGTGRALADGRRYRRARPRPNRRFVTAKTRRRLAALKPTERAALSALNAARRQPPRRSTVMHWFGSELAVQSR
jgi:hypothetical protein